MTDTQYDNPFDQDVEQVPTAEVELDEVDVPTEAEEKPKAKAKKESTRPAVPDGYISPVKFAKVLTEHLAAKGAENKNGPIGAENPMAPQQVYSYVLNSQAGDNRFPIYAQLKSGEIVSQNEVPEDQKPQRKNLIKLDGEGNPAEALAWWDAKDERVAGRRANAQAKADKKAKAAAEAPVEAEATEEVVEEAE